MSSRTGVYISELIRWRRYHLAKPDAHTTTHTYLNHDHDRYIGHDRGPDFDSYPDFGLDPDFYIGLYFDPDPDFDLKLA